MEALTDSPSAFTFSFDSSQTSGGSPFNAVAPTPISEWPAVKVNDDFFWSTQTTGVRFGKEASNSFVFPYDDYYNTGGVKKGVYTILDTGASAIYISSLWFDSFMDVLEEVAGTRLEPHEGRTYARCVNSFPPLYFQMSGHWIELAVKDYVIDVSRLQDGSICLIQVMRTDAPFNIYGMPLFVDYTTAFDDEASTISFKSTNGSLKSDLEPDSGRPA